MTIGTHTQPAQKRKRELRPLKGPGAVRGRSDGASRIDYTAEALADFQRYAAAADLDPDLRGFAAETLHLIRRSARALRQHALPGGQGRPEPAPVPELHGIHPTE